MPIYVNGQGESTRIAALEAYAAAISADQIVYVSSSGSDTTGDGTLTKPWATPEHALAVIPKFVRMVGLGATTAINYIVRIIAPYSGPWPNLSLQFQMIEKIQVGANPGGTTLRITLQNWVSGSIGAVDDARFTVISGPLTPTAVTTVAGKRVRYTFASDTITADDLWLGEQVRIFQSGVEVAHGTVYRSVNTGELLFVDPADVYTPATSDAVYIVRPAVQLGGTPSAPNTPINSSLVCTAGGSGFVQVRLENIRTIDNITITGDTSVTSVGCQHLANGGSGALTMNSPASLIMSSTVLAGVSLDAARGRSCVQVRSSGFCTAGRMTMSAGTVLIGQYFSGGNPLQGALSIGSATIRGNIISSAVGRSNTLISISGGTAPIPTLLVPRSGVLIDLSNSQLATAGVIAVDASLSAADVINLKDGARMFSDGTPAQFVPADATTVLAAGIVVKVLGDASAQVNVTSTLAGAGSVDVKAGDTAGVTWATLNGASPKRTTDTTKLCSVYA